MSSGPVQKPPLPMPSTTPIPAVGIVPPPTTAQPPPLPSSSTISGNVGMQTVATASYPQQYPTQPPLPPAGMYPTSGKVTIYFIQIKYCDYIPQ